MNLTENNASAYRCGADDFRKLVNEREYIYVFLDRKRYTRNAVKITKVEALALIAGEEKYENSFVLDLEYENTIYIEHFHYTDIRPAGGTVDTPGDNLAPR